MGEEWLVIRLDVGSQLGDYARRQYQGGLVPGFVVFDAHGAVAWRHGGSVPKLDTLLSVINPD